MAFTAAPLVAGNMQFCDGNGAPLDGGLVYTYVYGSNSTPKATWQDPTQTSQNANPIPLDGNGRAVIFGTGLYTLQLFDALGNQIFNAPGESSDPNYIASAIPVFTGDTGAGGAQGLVPAPFAGSAAAGDYLGAGGAFGPLQIVVPAAPAANQAGFLFVPGRTIAASTAALALTDAASEVSFSNASVASTLTIPSDATALWLTGVATQIMISNEIGSGVLTIARAAGVSLVWPGSSATSANRTLAANGQALLTHKRTANLWTIIGAGIS